MYGTFEYKCEVEGCGREDSLWIHRSDKDNQTCEGRGDWEHKPTLMRRLPSAIATTFSFMDPSSYKRSRK